jgi:hypothetical protein
MVESTNAIAKRWRNEGLTFTAADVTREWRRQGIEAARTREDQILADSPDSEVAQQIRDHRATGNYTTMGNLPE